MTILNDSNFNEEVKQYKGKVVVDFYADWCGPCRMMAPIFEELSLELTDIKFCKLNVDNNTVSREYGVMSIPTILVFENGEVINSSTGFMPKEELKKIIFK